MASSVELFLIFFKTFYISKEFIDFFSSLYKNTVGKICRDLMLLTVKRLMLLVDGLDNIRLTCAVITDTVSSL